jgi:hypothetical protein
VRPSASSNGTETGFEEGSLTPAISTDGQVMGFESEATNLAPGEALSQSDFYVHDESP